MTSRKRAGFGTLPYSDKTDEEVNIDSLLDDLIYLGKILEKQKKDDFLIKLRTLIQGSGVSLKKCKKKLTSS